MALRRSSGGRTGRLLDDRDLLRGQAVKRVHQPVELAIDGRQPLVQRLPLRDGIGRAAAAGQARTSSGQATQSRRGAPARRAWPKSMRRIGVAASTRPLISRPTPRRLAWC